MPMVTFSDSEGFSLGDNRDLADCGDDALVGMGLPEADRFQKTLRLSQDQFIYDRRFPDLQASRSNQFVLIEIVLPSERSRALKKDLLISIVENLRARIGVRAEDVMILFTETDRENWAYYDGPQYDSGRMDPAISGSSEYDSTEPSLVDFQG